MFNFLKGENPSVEFSIYRKRGGCKWKAVSGIRIIKGNKEKNKPFNQKHLHHCRPGWDPVCSLANISRDRQDRVKETADFIEEKTGIWNLSLKRGISGRNKGIKMH